MNQPTNYPPTMNAPAEPFICHIARAFRVLMRFEGLDDNVLPDDFSYRILRDGDSVPPEVWKYFAVKPRPEKGQLVFDLIRFIWAYHIDQMTAFPPGGEFIVAPPAMLGITWLRRVVETLDHLCLSDFGLDGCRSIDLRGRVTYPEVEEVRNRERQRTISRYGLYNHSRLKQWVMRLDELYGPYQPNIASDLTDPEIAGVIALQIHDLNPDVFD